MKIGVHYCLRARQGDYECLFCGGANLNQDYKENPYNVALHDILKLLEG